MNYNIQILFSSMVVFMGSGLAEIPLAGTWIADGPSSISLCDPDTSKHPEFDPRIFIQVSEDLKVYGGERDRYAEKVGENKFLVKKKADSVGVEWNLFSVEGQHYFKGGISGSTKYCYVGKRVETISAFTGDWAGFFEESPKTGVINEPIVFNTALTSEYLVLGNLRGRSEGQRWLTGGTSFKRVGENLYNDEGTLVGTVSDNQITVEAYYGDVELTVAEDGGVVLKLHGSFKAELKKVSP